MTEKLLTPWQAWSGRWRGEDALVVGNGPSRLGHDDVIAGWPGPVVACNAYWMRNVRAPEALVCYDSKQSDAALASGISEQWSLFVPEQTSPSVNLTVDPTPGSRVFEASPHRPTAQPQDVAVPGWEPDVMAVGAFSGMLAFQLAWIAGAETISLLGIDVSGMIQPADGTVRLSAIDEDVPGYRHQHSNVEACRQLAADAMVPGDWDDALAMWAALTAVAKQRGIRVYRAVSGGALGWVETRCLRGTDPRQPEALPHE